ncbi:uncharacterized protein LOC129893205 isoform X2 [Solanum dulcamara]|uniref:uncharacterized protein LOC129893205 isoform X2 n=1 Tax=Solanum dulcamara TaxID=45834 RepID=UPI002485AC30|nr:uncharacterized protein LOC129893205 isoform X2 [Solanum dulcamara]
MVSSKQQPPTAMTSCNNAQQQAGTRGSGELRPATANTSSQCRFFFSTQQSVLLPLLHIAPSMSSATTMASLARLTGQEVEDGSPQIRLGKGLDFKVQDMKSSFGTGSRWF